MRGRWTAMVRNTARAAISGLDGADDAPAVMRHALDAWSSAGLLLDHALATLCALCVLPSEAKPIGDVEQARTYLAGLNAASLLRLFDGVAR
jgi:hypothetical protein